MKRIFVFSSVIAITGFIAGIVVPTVFVNELTCETRLMIVSITSLCAITFLILCRVRELDKYEEAVRNLSIDAERRILNAEDASRVQIDAAKNEHRLEITRIEESNRNEIAHLEEKYRNGLQGIEERRRNEIDQLFERVRNAEELSQLRDQHARDEIRKIEENLSLMSEKLTQYERAQKISHALKKALSGIAPQSPTDCTEE